MRTYQIYLIEDEFARHYLGRERIFFNLFGDYSQAEGKHKLVLEKQIEYVTKCIPSEYIEQTIDKRIKKLRNFKSRESGHYIEKINGYSKASLAVDQEVITVRAEGDFEAETAYFECIRKCESSFLAIDIENEKYGWLKPIKERKFV
ncbi:sporulation inhibitor of replication protein SirA [Bacillus massiliglaciei]|uniref:sporulation inhibitor of replication protein SirA n=1 Tax=Bacillus massiliglaciei TaxID=1816693 RepID=UPI000DA6231E|nr:sporulation inhibitor of replication protein SirA [Bacillus massiliglaciei]